MFKKIILPFIAFLFCFFSFSQCNFPIATFVDNSTVDICPPTSNNPGNLTVSFDASASTSALGTSISRYEWYWGDGTFSFTTTPITNHTFPGVGVYEVLLRVRDDNTTVDPDGCISNNDEIRVIRVTPEPSFSGSSPNTINIDCGETVNLSGIVSSQTRVQGVFVLGSAVSLPDGNGVSYESSVDLTGLFATGSVVDPGCYPIITLNLEHSYSGDLNIDLIAPTGETVRLFNQIGADTNFGTCTNPADNLVFGCPASYTIVNSGGVAWNSGGTTTTTTSNCPGYTGTCEGGGYFISQTYNSVNSFAVLDGADLNGEWTLRITDQLSQDDGHINGWSLEFPQSCFDDLRSVTPNIVSATWSHTGSGPSIPTQTPTNTPNIDPGPDNCPVAGTCLGNEIDNTVLLGPFNSLTGPFTYTLTAIDEFGCEFTYDVDINVNAAGNPTFDPVPPICSGVTTSPLPTTSTNGITGTWTPAFNTTTTTYTFTPDPGQCISPTSTVDLTIVVNPAPILSMGLDASVCSNEAIGIVFDVESGSVAATSYNITAINNNGLVATAGVPITGTGFSASEIADDSYINTTNIPVVVTYTVVPVSADSCEGDPVDVNVTIIPQPVLSPSLDTPVCSDEASGVLLDVAPSSVAAASYNITTINTNGLIASAGTPITGTGFTASEIADDAYTNTTNAPVVVTYTVVPVSADNCEGDPVDVNVNITPEPVLSSSLDSPVCSDEASGVLLDVAPSSVAAASYNITAINTNGLVASAGTPIIGTGFTASEIADDAYTNSTNTPVDVAYTVVPVSADNCEGAPLDIILTINPLPVITDMVDLLQCDNDADGFSDFNLTESEVLISANSANETFTYHLTLADANAGINAITNPLVYTNTDPSSNPDTIYVRVENAETCYRVAELDLFVSATQIPANVEILYEECDTDADGDITNGITTFDFSDAEAQIRAQSGLPTGQNLTFTYYETEADALAETNAITDISNYTNTQAFGQDIWVRVDSDVDNACIGLGMHVRLETINPTPNTNPAPIILCDDVTLGDLVETFDLTQNEAFIFNGDPDVVATYHLSFAAANSGVDAIPIPTAYQNTDASETIFVRVTNPNTTCYAIVEQDILVNPLPDANVVVTDFFECENNTDFIFDFDLESKIPEILNGQDPTQFTVTFHDSQQDADGLVDALPNPYTNMSNPQQIFVAITNSTTGCSISTLSFFIEVNEGAEAVDDFYEECDVEGDPNVTQFDLDSRSANILNGQDPTAFSISYHDSFDDAFNNTQPLPLLYENLTNPQILYARVSNVIRPDECFEIAELTLQVNPLPNLDLDDEYILCLTSNGEAVVDVPLIIDTGLADADYSFEWSLDGTVLTTETGSTITPLQGGTYSVVVTDTSTSTVTMCMSSDSTEVIESGIPDTFSVDVTSEAFTGNNMLIAQATGNSTYEFSLDNGPWQLDGEFTDVSGGEHIVYVRDVNGCGVLSRTVTVIDYPKFFTPNGDGNHDTWTIKGIDTQPQAVIYIFDRYGKLLKQLSPTSPGWDGTFNGNLMPSSDYWFTLEYIEPTNDEMRTFSAHFALKR